MEDAWAGSGLDAFSGSSVEYHAWSTGASGSAAARGGAGKMHVGAGWLAVSALIPDLIGWAEFLGHTVVSSAVPFAALACASVAEFFAGLSVSVVDSLVGALALSNWNALKGFFINGVTWETVASSDTLLSTAVWLDSSAGLATVLATLLVNLTSGAGDSAFSMQSPVGDDLSGEGAFTGIRCHSGTLTINR